MKIYVVQRGDTISALARLFQTTTQTIITTNGLQNLPYLVPGQSLVIPVNQVNYTVRSGDSLYLISQRFQIPLTTLQAANPNAGTLQPGQTVRVPLSAPQFGTIETNGYILPTPEGELEVINSAGPSLTYIAPFSYAVRPDGSLEPLPDEDILRTARLYNDAPLLVITNYRNGNFDSDLAHTILSNVSIQDTLISNILRLMRQKGYYGLNIDFERIPPEDRQLYNNFLRKIVPAMHAFNYPVATDLVPKSSDITTGAWHGAHDYRAHGEILDFVILMTYDWGWAGGPPYPIAPITEVSKVLDYAVSVIPRKKIMMGIPLYGYDWTLPYHAGGKWATMISNLDALQLAATHGAEIQYDRTFQAPYFNYYDNTGAQHVVWFDDARSIRAKYELAYRYGIRGVSFWNLNLPFPQNWVVLNSLFKVRKIGPGLSSTLQSTLSGGTQPAL